MKIFKMLIAVIALITIATAQPKAHTQGQTQGKFKIKCCFKLGIPTINFHRPKKDCKKGFGFCIKNGYACFLCNFDDTTPDCYKCASGKMSGTTELSGNINDLDLTLEITNTFKSDPEFIDEDFSVFYLDEDFQLYDAATKELRATLKAGEYKKT